MPLYDVGPRIFKSAGAASTLSLTPLTDRAAVVKRILVDKPSAGDTWIVSCAGKELARFDIQTTGNQQPLSGPYSGYPKTNDIFELYKYTYNEELVYPIPVGQTLTVSSLGGATANISMSYTEMTPAEVGRGMMNHPQGTRFVTLLTGYRNANVTVVGENTLDTQVGPTWFPNLFVDGNIPSGWDIKVLAMFLEGGGRNTYNGSADHQSNTTYFAVIKNGLRMYTRDALGGITLIGQASAAGSANTVVGNDESPMPPFQEADMYDFLALDMPLDLGGGDLYQFRLNVAGDVTGGAAYAAMRQLFLVDVRVSGS